MSLTRHRRADSPLAPDAPVRIETMDWHRILSGTLGLVYVVIAYSAGGAGVALRVAAGLTLPLACIWFGDELGSLTGVMRGQAITSETPGCLVRLGGWLIMSLPLIVGAIELVNSI